METYERFTTEFSMGGFPICNKHEEIEDLADQICRLTDIEQIDGLATAIMNIVACCRDDAINMENALRRHKGEI